METSYSMDTPLILFKRTHILAEPPAVAHGGYQDNVGADLRSVEQVTILPGDIGLVRTGLCVAIPPGYELQIRSRSGLARLGIFVANSPATIDPSYRGEIGVLLYNSTDHLFHITPGYRIAQAVVARYSAPAWREADTLGDTLRGTDGFGSTGK